MKPVSRDDNAQDSAGAPHATQLFVYGTLRHDKPEHARFCRGVTHWRRARVRGRLWQLSSGYLMLVLSARDVLLHATSDAAADERLRARLEPAAANREDASDASWIEGEVLFFRDAAIAWPPIDRWEDYTPGQAGAYQRCVVPAKVCAAENATEALAFVWAYVATKPPPGAFQQRQ
ncbi:MAG: gamma-glutamylcyclotransferase [Opitutaceae bacterium]